MGILFMVNLLIGMMMGTFNKFLQTSDSILYREYYNIMCSFEKQMTSSELRKVRKYYSFRHSSDELDEPTYYKFSIHNLKWMKSENISTFPRLSSSDVELLNTEGPDLLQNIKKRLMDPNFFSRQDLVLLILY